MRSAKWGGKGKKRGKKLRTGGEDDLYALLGLQHERWLATPEQIKASYRKVALVHHPDKQVRRGTKAQYLGGKRGRV